MIPCYAALTNRKLIIPSPATSYMAVENHFFYEMMGQIVGRIRVDEDWYLETYPDIDTAVREAIVPDAQTHYRRFGYFEHRLPYRIDIDEAWYLEQYPDVQDAVTAGTFPDAQTHFDRIGFREGRFPWPSFKFDLQQ